MSLKSGSKNIGSRSGIVEDSISISKFFSMNKIELEVLEKFISTIPGVKTCGMGFSEDEKMWWIKLVVDISHPLAWNVVQEL